MDKLFDKLPYDDLDGIKFIHLLAGAAGIGLALFIAYYFTLYSATNTEFKMLAKQKVEAERTLKRYKGIVAKKDRVGKKLALVKGKFDSFKNQMPSQAEIPNLIQRISVFGRDRKMKMVALTVEEGELKSFYKVIPLKVQLDGELWDTLDFIEYMQNLLRLVSFDSLILQAQSDKKSRARSKGTTGGLIKTTLMVKTYSFLEGAEDRKPVKKKSSDKKAKTKKKGH